MKFLVTGGAGFIGSCFILQRIANGDSVLNLDKLTYAGNPENLSSIADHPNYYFVQGDIADKSSTAYSATSNRSLSLTLQQKAT